MAQQKKQTKAKGAGKPRRVSKAAAKATKATRTPKPATPRADRARDPRLPAAGTTLVRPYKGKDYRVTVLDDGFRYDGREFRSLSKLASEITGQRSINGYLWLRLTGGPADAPKPMAPKRKGRAAASDAVPAPGPAQESATA